jgi:anti-sigma regulatory factor (Ser/Thr protein kinase)
MRRALLNPTGPPAPLASRHRRGGSDPTGEPAPPRPWRLWLAAFAAWTFLGLCQTAQIYLFPDSRNIPLSAARSLGFGFGLVYGWGLLWLLAFPLARRFALGQNHWYGRLALHAGAGIVFAVAKILLDYPVVLLFYCSGSESLPFSVFFRMGFTGYFFRYVVFYWAMIGVAHALGYYGKYRDGELRAARLEAGLARARLQLLKTQLQPHFLFNTLNAVSALVHTDVEAADRVLARLGELLRLALEDFGVQEAPLARELDVVRSYLDIEQTRLGPRLCVRWDVAPDTLDALVPTFLLQPLVENAVRHGVALRVTAGRIEVRAWRDGDRLHLEVRDDGPGLPARPAAEGGVGLANTRARLLHLYGTAGRLEAGNDPHGGCVVTITLPFREQGEVRADGARGPDDPNADC